MKNINHRKTVYKVSDFATQWFIDSHWVIPSLEKWDRHKMTIQRRGTARRICGYPIASDNRAPRIKDITVSGSWGEPSSRDRCLP